MWTFFKSFIFFTLLAFCAQFVASESPIFITDSKDLVNFLRNKDGAPEQQVDVRLLNERINILSERVDFLSEILKNAVSNPGTRFFDKEQTNYSDFLIEEKLQTKELKAVVNHTKEIRDAVLERKELLKNIEGSSMSESVISISNLITGPNNCKEATRFTQRSGVYEIELPKSNMKPFKVYCDNDIDSGGWTVILRRVDGSVNFNRNWEEYKEGFGNLRGEFFIGLEKLHALTTYQDYELYIAMESINGDKKYAKYDRFVIGSEDEAYLLKDLGYFEGNTSDAFRYHAFQKFSTNDRDNDNGVTHCANRYEAGWWFEHCYDVLFTASYEPTEDTPNSFVWKGFNEDEDWIKLIYAQMMIRPI